MLSKRKKAIKAIINFKKVFDKIEPKVPRKLAGDMGEFYVLRELENNGFKCEHKGGYAGCDIYIPDVNKRIEVKTSLLKNEGIFNKGINFYGWKFQNKNQKRIEKFDILVCVALDDEFINPNFYIFTYQEAFSVEDVNIRRYPSIKKKICLFENKRALKEAIRTKPELVTKFEKYFNLNALRFRDKWAKIKKQK